MEEAWEGRGNDPRDIPTSLSARVPHSRPWACLSTALAPVGVLSEVHGRRVAAPQRRAHLRDERGAALVVREAVDDGDGQLAGVALRTRGQTGG